ncbi:capping complex subunit for YIEGIA [Virgibacillus ainsalahensis]
MLEKAILAVITTNRTRISGGAPTFFCNNAKELEEFAANLEAITDGIAHSLSDEVFIIVKH